MLGNGHHTVPAGKVAMAVTYLEMTAASALPEVTAPAGVNFAPLAYAPESYRDLFRRVGADWLWYYRLTLSDAALASHFADPGIALYALTFEGQTEGLLELDFRTEQECELAYFGLTSKLIGTGAGRYLMTEGLRLAWERPITRMHLHTCNYDSPQALGFYIRSGFTPYKREIEIDDDPRLTGILPRSAAPHVPLITS